MWQMALMDQRAFSGDFSMRKTYRITALFATPTAGADRATVYSDALDP
jgi:hypothetical protein